MKLTFKLFFVLTLYTISIILIYYLYINNHELNYQITAVTNFIKNTSSKSTGKLYSLIKISDQNNIKTYLKSISKNKILIVTFANANWIDFALNWASHIKSLNITNYIIIALDNKTYDKLRNSNINTYNYNGGNVSEANIPWGSQQFHKLGRVRVDMIRELLSYGFDIIISDVDVVYLRNPIEYFIRHPDADIMASSDNLEPSVQNENLELFEKAQDINIGILMLRTSAMEFVEAWKDSLSNDPLYWEQASFNKLYKLKISEFSDDTEKNIYNAFNNKIKFGILPIDYFCSGHTYFVARRPQEKNIMPFAVHTTYQFSGTIGKRHRLKEALLWDIYDNEYFNRKNGYISFDMKYNWENANETIEGHFAFINHQLTQIRIAMAFAITLNRALIMPPVWCALDRWWSVHPGRIPGSKLKLPFLCPLDHLFELKVIENIYTDTGKNFDIREYSFLYNKRLPENVKNSTLNVTFKKLLENENLSYNQIVLDNELTDVNLKLMLENDFKEVRIIHFNSLENVNFKFKNITDGEIFQEKTRKITGLWCCTKGHPGHIWYDLWWDTVPHIDMHNRLWNGTWHPILGP